MKSYQLRTFNLLLISLLSVASWQCNRQEAIPDILKNHPEKDTFTKLKEAKTIALFNGKDYTGWYTYTPNYGTDNDVEKAFTVEDGVMKFSGPSMGYVCTKDSYKNYYLRLQIRWGDRKYPPRENVRRDSGLLYHFPEGVNDELWPLSVECQIQEDDFGDYYFVNGALAGGSSDGIIHSANFEKAIPEWNTIEVICVDNKSEHYVNGHLVAQAQELNLNEGKIFLQLEGAEVFYKDIVLLPLK
ncbi:MAG: DUF1080 domain-containing protein [Bacteroidales bacterium]|jgi:hypothetical protein|nr:DUF1080 domain-containing protein [Bacteroidales bacterium]